MRMICREILRATPAPRDLGRPVVNEPLPPKDLIIPGDCLYALFILLEDCRRTYLGRDQDSHSMTANSGGICAVLRPLLAYSVEKLEILRPSSFSRKSLVPKMTLIFLV